NATARQWYGDFLYATGRLDESIVELQRAADLDPYSPVMRNDLGATLGIAGRWAEGLREMERAVELDSSLIWARGNLAVALARQGHLDSAEKLAAEAGEFAPYARIMILLGAKRFEEAADLGRGLTASRPEAFNSDVFIVGYAARMNADSTIYWLNRAVDLRDGFLFAPSIPCHPLFEFIQNDRRFIATLTRMKVRRCSRS
ncbi:MAG: tetratricopeptide repeat protein, partial [Gemmatimonadaceae bacterium]